MDRVVVQEEAVVPSESKRQISIILDDWKPSAEMPTEVVAQEGEEELPSLPRVLLWKATIAYPLGTTRTYLHSYLEKMVYLLKS